jgi:heme oxygenase
VYPLERALHAAGVARVLPDWSDRARSEALRADLAALDVPEPEAADAPALRGEAYLFGVLYVLEGSRLGAKLLTRQILSDASARMRRATRYLRHGEGKPLWQTFLERLETSAAVKHSPEQAIAGACAAFSCFGAGHASQRDA